MTKRIFRSILTVALAALLACLVLITGVLYGYFEERVERELQSQTAYILRGVEDGGLDYLSGIPQYISPGLGASDYYRWQPGRLFNSPTVTMIALTARIK